MKNKIIAAIILLIVLSTLGFAGCRGKPSEASQRQIAEVERGDLIVSVPADGNLDMPREVELKFGTPGTVKEIFAVEGQKVKEGALLAKLDDTQHKFNIAIAQYNVELAMNELIEKTQIEIMYYYPKLFLDAKALLPVEQAQEELEQTLELIERGKYQDAVAELRLAQCDLKMTLETFESPELAELSQEYNEMLDEPVQKYPEIPEARECLGQNLEGLASIQKLIEQGKYTEASAELITAQIQLQKTHKLVKSLSGKIRVAPHFTTPNPVGPKPLPYNPQQAGAQQQAGGLQQASCLQWGPDLQVLYYPDISTSLSWLSQAEEDLLKMQGCMQQWNCTATELGKALRLAQHEVEMSRTILQDNELIFRGGLNLKALRAYNISLQQYEITLKNAKEELMKTEILAPFDGTVVDIGVKENDQLSSFDYSSKTAVYLVDTSTVEMDGVVDEIDIYKVKVGQEAIITVDALPDVELKGKVTFISPFGTGVTGIIEFPVTISVEPAEIELKGGLTATADIIVEKHEDVLLIPNRSIKGSPGDHWVEVVIDEEKVTTEKRPVVLGAQNEQFGEVISGLNEGEKIIVESTRSRITTLF